MSGPQADTTWKQLATFAFLAGSFFIAFIYENNSWGTPTPDKVLATFQGNQMSFDLTAITLGIATAAGIAFFAILGTRLRPGNNGLSLAAAILFSIGISVFAFSTVIFVAILNAVANLGAAANSTEAIFEAAVWYNAYQTIGYFGEALSGLGLILVGSLMWKSKIYPNWLAIVCFIGGIGGFVSIVGVLDIINGVALLILIFGAGVISIRNRDRSVHSVSLK